MRQTPQRLLRLQLSLFEELHVAQRVGGDDAADRADAVTSVHYFFIRIQNETRRVNYFPPLFPKGADLFRIRWDFKAVGHRKSQLQLLHGLLGFIQWIYREGDDIDGRSFELFGV
jgi:hypothetical protein